MDDLQDTDQLVVFDVSVSFLLRFISLQADNHLNDEILGVEQLFELDVGLELTFEVSVEEADEEREIVLSFCEDAVSMELLFEAVVHEL